jgi:hypothetical protein
MQIKMQLTYKNVCKGVAAFVVAVEASISPGKVVFC